ncbi:MAG TPA: DUF2764 family protein [Rhabdochlamydiaceae bacterium]|nr:DUF2764 family protein [Rhabdochlamydiaceae bacterium]
MANYYFVAPSFPSLVLGQKPDISFEELKTRLHINLTKDDLEKTVVFCRFIDLNNIRSLLLGEPIDPRGNLTEKELDEALLVKNILPSYVFDFLDQYESVEDKVKNITGLLTRYFAEEIPKQKGFLKKYLIFERNWRLVMLGLRAKETGRDVIRELQFEDFSDPIVAGILAQKDASQYEPPLEFMELKEILASCGSDPLEKYKAFAAWRFQKIEEMVQRPLFSIDWILSYMARLIIVEDWNELDENKGKVILDDLKTG